MACLLNWSERLNAVNSLHTISDVKQNNIHCWTFKPRYVVWINLYMINKRKELTSSGSGGLSPSWRLKQAKGGISIWKQTESSEKTSINQFIKTTWTLVGKIYWYMVSYMANKSTDFTFGHLLSKSKAASFASCAELFLLFSCKRKFTVALHMLKKVHNLMF